MTALGPCETNQTQRANDTDQHHRRQGIGQTKSCSCASVIQSILKHHSQRGTFRSIETGLSKDRVRILLVPITIEWQTDKVVLGIVGNVLIHGVNTRSGLALISSRGDAFLEDNLAMDQSGNPVPITSGEIEVLTALPLWFEGLVTFPASSVANEVARRAGARPRDRDAVDRRIIRDFLARQGRVIDSQDEVGGYPQAAMTTRKLDIPQNVESWLARLAAEVE